MKKQFIRIFRHLYFPREKADLRSRHGGSKETAGRRGPARGLSINFGFGCCLAVATLSAFGNAHAEPTDDSLRIYAVDIWQDPPQSWGPGRGVYLGNGLVITA